MPLVEIIRGEQTSDEALAKAYDVVLQIRKTPIVVNDSRGFYTSRVIGTMVNEGLAMLAEGVHPMSLERAATQAGYPVGPLQLTDELNMELMAKIAQGDRGRRRARRHDLRATTRPARSIAHDDRARPRRHGCKGAGFYDYDERATHDAVARARRAVPASPTSRSRSADVKDRLLFIEAHRDREVLRGGRHRARPRPPTSARSWASAPRPGPAARCSS